LNSPTTGAYIFTPTKPTTPISGWLQGLGTIGSLAVAVAGEKNNNKDYPRDFGLWGFLFMARGKTSSSSDWIDVKCP